jgi:hypothetical protein
MNLTDAFSILEHALRETTRAEILDAVQRSRDSATAIARLRTRMREHAFPTSAAPIALDRIVHDLDRRTRAEGFHPLQSWDYRAHRFVDDPTAILMLNRVAGRGDSGVAERVVLSALLDQYFLWILGLLALRAWDGEDPNANLDRVTDLLRLLKPAREHGSALVEDAALLLLVAVSQYHPQEEAYSNLLDRVCSLDKAHRTRIAVFAAATLGGHLRWGFRFMYQHDYVRMRDDNVVDYPWLFFALETLLDRYGEVVDKGASDGDTAVITTALINALSADPWVLTDERSLSPQLHRQWRQRVGQRLSQCSSGLLTRITAHRPGAMGYSPLSFDCNYLHNLIVAMIDLATTKASAQESLDSLLTTADGDAIHALGSARRLARYAACTAQAVGGAALIAYDSFNGSKCFDAALDVLRHVPEIATAALPRDDRTSERALPLDRVGGSATGSRI